MPNLLENFYANLLQTNEHFDQNESNGPSIRNLLPTLLAIITVDILLLIFGKYLWNTYLVQASSSFNPIKSIIDLLAIKILLRLLLN
tara:strand:- start:5110 stop:5370 length:261 start_codon:yes stop_codon:yes gene_type:complete